jgi:hypothetical protein
MPQDALQDAINEFVAKVRAITREEAMVAMRNAFTDGAAPAASPWAGRARAGKAARGGRRAKGQKRDPRELEALVQKLAAFIKSKPGQRIEQIGAALQVPTKELALPAKKLLAAKKIRTRGNRRATKYFPKA